MSQLLPSNDRTSHLIVANVVGLLVFALVILVAVLVADDDGSDGSSGHCTPAVAGPVDPVTCLPYTGTGTGHTGTNNSGSSGQRPKTPAVKVPAAPKAPAAPPRVRLTK
ncbi:hypothetical protein ACWEGS_28825 [Streptomyces sp. NPDC004822]